MPVVKAGNGKYRIPNVPGTGTKAEKEAQLAAIKARQAGKPKRKPKIEMAAK